MKSITVEIESCDCPCEHCHEDGSMTEVICPYCEEPFYADGNFEYREKGKEKVECPECGKKMIIDKRLR